jgi:hypothetical protein
VTLWVLGMPPGTPTEVSTAGGGTRILAMLKAIREAGLPPIDTRLRYCAIDHLEIVPPAHTKSEHGPLERNGTTDDRSMPWPTPQPQRSRS